MVRLRLSSPVRDGWPAPHAGVLELHALPDRTFGPVFSVNVVQFLPGLDDALGKILAALKRGGRAATACMPRDRNPAPADALRPADRVAQAKAAAGFTGVRVEDLPLGAAPAVCVPGTRCG